MCFTRETRLRFKVGLICILLGVYLLIYTNAPDSIDSRAILGTAATLVQHGRPTIDVIRATDGEILPPFARMGKVGPDGALYSKKGIVTSLLLVPLVALAKLAPWLSISATAMLFNALIATATALILYSFVEELGYRKATAFILALIFGIATVILAYVK